MTSPPIKRGNEFRPFILDDLAALKLMTETFMKRYPRSDMGLILDAIREVEQLETEHPSTMEGFQRQREAEIEAAEYKREVRFLSDARAVGRV